MKQGKSGSPAKRAKVVPLNSSTLGRRIAALESKILGLEGQRTMLIRVVGAMASTITEQPADVDTVSVLVPFDAMNVSRDIGFAIRKGEQPGVVIEVKNMPKAKPVDSAKELAAAFGLPDDPAPLADPVAPGDPIGEAKLAAERDERAVHDREERDRSTRRS